MDGPSAKEAREPNRLRVILISAVALAVLVVLGMLFFRPRPTQASTPSAQVAILNKPKAAIHSAPTPEVIQSSDTNFQDPNDRPPPVGYDPVPPRQVDIGPSSPAPEAESPATPPQNKEEPRPDQAIDPTSQIEADFEARILPTIVGVQAHDFFTGQQARDLSETLWRAAFIRDELTGQNLEPQLMARVRTDNGFDWWAWSGSRIGWWRVSAISR